MGLLYQRKNDFDEEDGRTAQFTDFLVTPPAEGSDLDLIKEKKEENPKLLEEEVNKGKKTDNDKKKE